MTERDIERLIKAHFLYQLLSLRHCTQSILGTVTRQGKVRQGGVLSFGWYASDIGCLKFWLSFGSLYSGDVCYPDDIALLTPYLCSSCISPWS